MTNEAVNTDIQMERHTRKYFGYEYIVISGV